MGIAKINTTGLLPTGASPVERYHRSLGASLTMVCNKSKNDWSFMVDSVVFAYNISVNKTTGFSPFYLASGRHPSLPLEILAGLRSASVRHKGAPYVERMTAALNKAYGMVRERQLRTLKRNQRYQLGLTSQATQQQVEEARRPIPGFRAGDLVSYWQPEIADRAITHVMSKKLQYRWNGPYPVLERENDHFHVEIKGVRTLVNPGRLRKYYKWVDDPWEREGDGLRRPGRQLNSGEVEVPWVTWWLWV